MTGQNDNAIPIRSRTRAARRLENKLSTLTCSDESEGLRNELLWFRGRLVEMSADLEREKAERVQELGTVVHGLRNPASSILSATEYLIEDAAEVLTEEQMTLLRGAAQSTSLILRMIENILDFSKSECGRLTAHFTPSNLMAIANEVVRINQLQADRRGIDLRTHFDRPCLVVDLDPCKMTQVIDNLIGNAIRFSSPGGTVDIISGATESFAFLSIRDEGAGIPADRLKKIFEPFQHSANGKASYMAGAGLGLAISKRIVDLHCGRIVVESKPGRGSNFTIYLPMRAETRINAVRPNTMMLGKAAGQA